MMMRKFAAALSVLLPLFACQPAFAAACPLAASASGTCACTVGTGSTVCLNAKTTASYRVITVDNESATAIIACTDDGTTPALNTAGSWTIQPLQTRQWPTGPNLNHSGPLNCLSNTASTPVTVKGQ
jgi:hypothetical protein